MKRFARFWLGVGLFALPFLLLCAHPQTRDLFLKQVSGQTGLMPAPPWASSRLSYGADYEPYATPTPAPEVATPLLSRLAADVRVQIIAAQEAAFREAASVRVPRRPTPQARLLPLHIANVRPPDVAAPPGLAPKVWGTPRDIRREPFWDARAKLLAQKYEALLKQHPRNAWLYALCLRAHGSWMRDERAGGDFSNVHGTEYKAAGLPSPEDTGVPPNFTTQEWGAALTIARQAQKLEPRNAYFGWHEATLLWAARRDEEAMRALRRASLLPDYDAHEQETSAASLFVHERARPMLWEEKVSVIDAQPFDEWARMRERTRQWSWRGVKLERAGRGSEDVAMRADVARFAHKMQGGRNSVTSGFVGTAIEMIIWAGLNRRIVHKNLPPKPQVRVRLIAVLGAQKFAAYATKHGRPDLARETGRIGRESGEFRAAWHNNTVSSQYGTSTALATDVRARWWMGAALLCGIALCGALWVPVSLFLLRARGESGPLWSVAALAVPCALLSGGLLWSSRGVVEYADLFLMAWRDWNTPANSASTRQIAALIAAPALLLSVPALGCGLPTWWRMNRAQRQEFAPEPSFLPRDMKPLVWRFLVWNTIAAALLGPVFMLVAALAPNFTMTLQPFGMADSQFFGGFGAMLTTVGVPLWFLGWIVAWRFFRAPDERPQAHGALRRYRATLGALMVTLAWLYALTLGSSLAPRARADAQLQAFVQRGK